MIERRNGTLLGGSQGRLSGYAAVFGSESVDLGGFHEIVLPGAFTRSLEAGGNVCALWQHDSGALLGTTHAKTLRLAEDAKGLRFELDLPETSHGRDLRTLVERGDVGHCSFGFTVESDRWIPRGEGWLRELHAVALAEITLTSSPAYPDTSVALRARKTRERYDVPLLRLWIDTVL